LTIEQESFVPAAASPHALARAERSRRWRTARRVARDVLQDVSIAVLFVVFFVTFVAQAFRVQGPSMMPLLQDGERIIVYKLGYRWSPILRGDVVVFWSPLEPSVSFVKRVVGLPGDRLEIRRGVVLVNGKVMAEPYLQARFRQEEDVGPVDVRPGHYFVMGDHRNQSYDSRSWGEVPLRYIYGRAVLRFWPIGRAGRL
jgi:signal peptidase I